MFKTYFLILLLGHVVGDFYFQNTKMAKDKFEKFSSFFIHILLYMIAIILVCIPIWNNKLIVPIIIASFSHAIIDAIKAIISKIKKFSHIKNKEVFIFIFDQFLHFLCIILIAVSMTKENITVSTNVLSNWLTYLNIDYLFVVKFLIILLSNIRPCNIFIKTIIQKYKPMDNACDNTKKSQNIGAGAIIGVLERYLIAAFFVNNQYSLIGLILTAKSIARFNKLSENKDFAEYYLMGTLLSLLLVVGLCIITL